MGVLQQNRLAGFEQDVTQGHHHTAFGLAQLQVFQLLTQRVGLLYGKVGFPAGEFHFGGTRLRQSPGLRRLFHGQLRIAGLLGALLQGCFLFLALALRLFGRGREQHAGPLGFRPGPFRLQLPRADLHGVALGLQCIELLLRLFTLCDHAGNLDLAIGHVNQVHAQILLAGGHLGNPQGPLGLTHCQRCVTGQFIIGLELVELGAGALESQVLFRRGRAGAHQQRGMYNLGGSSPNVTNCTFVDSNTSSASRQEMAA